MTGHTARDNYGRLVYRRTLDGLCWACGTRNAADALFDETALNYCERHLLQRRRVAFRITEIPYRRLREGRPVSVTP